MGWFDFGQHDRIEQKLDVALQGINDLTRRIKKMAVDEKALLDALQAFSVDMSAGIQAIKDKIDSLPGVDLTAELDALTSIQSAFDSAVAEITTPPTP